MKGKWLPLKVVLIATILCGLVGMYMRRSSSKDPVIAALEQPQRFRSSNGILNLSTAWSETILLDTEHGENIIIASVGKRIRGETLINGKEPVKFDFITPGNAERIEVPVATVAYRVTNRQDEGAKIGYCRYYGPEPPANWYEKLILAHH